MFKISDEDMEKRHKQDPRHRLIPRMYAAHPILSTVPQLKD